MTRRIVFSLLLTVLPPAFFLAEAQQAKVYRGGVIHQGGPYGAEVFSKSHDRCPSIRSAGRDDR